MVWSRTSTEDVFDMAVCPVSCDGVAFCSQDLVCLSSFGCASSSVSRGTSRRGSSCSVYSQSLEADLDSSLPRHTLYGHLEAGHLHPFPSCRLVLCCCMYTFGRVSNVVMRIDLKVVRFGVTCLTTVRTKQNHGSSPSDLAVSPSRSMYRELIRLQSSNV